METSDKQTMTLDEAAPLYSVKLSTLRLMCIRGDVNNVKVGKRRYVTKEAMDAVFKGIVAEKPKAR